MASNFNISTDSKLIAYQVEADLFLCRRSNADLHCRRSKADLHCLRSSADRHCRHSKAGLQIIDCDILAIKFDEDIEKSKKILKNNLSEIEKPLMICGCGKDDVDRVLLPELIKILDRECIISYVTEKTYKDIIPFVIKGGHYVILKTPIDINLAKELNILCLDMGLDKNKIIMNTDIGGLGYGYEYGYSIMEKIRLESGDEYLNMPLVSEAGLESLKTKEAKFGGKKRSKMTELAAVSGALAAGANIVLVKNSDNINIIRGLL